MAFKAGPRSKRAPSEFDPQTLSSIGPEQNCVVGESSGKVVTCQTEPSNGFSH